MRRRPHQRHVKACEIPNDPGSAPPPFDHLGLKMKNKTTAWILAALVIGIAGGLLAHWLLPEGPRNGLVTILDTVTHMFLNLIKMIIAPLIFATLVSGIAGAAKSAGV